MNRRVLLLDAYGLFYRALFALPAMSTRRGEPTSGVYGFTALVLKLLREERPAGAAVALDVGAPTFRHAAYRAYKATRGEGPALGTQVERLEQVIDAFGFPRFGAPGFEADDVLATLARELAAGGEVRPVVVTGDRDCMQLATGATEILYAVRGGARPQRYDEAAIVERFGVRPEQLPDFAALVGDPSDNLPGVPGIGPRTAARLIREHGGVPGLLAALPRVEPARVRQVLAAHAALLPLWLHLSRLRTDVPLPPGPRWAPLTDAARARVRALFEELEFASLVGRL